MPHPAEALAAELAQKQTKRWSAPVKPQNSLKLDISGKQFEDSKKALYNNSSTRLENKFRKQKPHSGFGKFDFLVKIYPVCRANIYRQLGYILTNSKLFLFFMGLLPAIDRSFNPKPSFNW